MSPEIQIRKMVIGATSCGNQEFNKNLNEKNNEINVGR